MKRDKKTCTDCGASPLRDKNVKLHVHHVIPLANGGKTTLENLVTNCDTCNLGKSNVVLDNWQSVGNLRSIDNLLVIFMFQSSF